MERWKINQNGNKNSFRVKNQAKLAQVTDLLEQSVTEDINSNHASQIEEHDLRDLTAAGEQINNLK